MSLLDFKIDDNFLNDLETSLTKICKESSHKVYNIVTTSEVQFKDAIEEFIYKRVTKRTGLLGQSAKFREIQTETGVKTELYFDKNIAVHAYTHLGDSYEQIVPVRRKWLTVPVFETTYMYPRPTVGDFDLKIKPIPSGPIWVERDTDNLMFVGKKAVNIPHRINIDELTRFVSDLFLKKTSKELRDFLNECLP